jgi:Ca2+-transporting ATPase
MTLTFTTFVLFQLFNVFNARSERHSVLGRHMFNNRLLWLAVLGVLVLQVVALGWQPARDLFHTIELSLADWGVAVAVAASVMVMEELRKLVTR